MIALIKTFTLQQSAVSVSEYFQGTSSISSSFAVKIDRLSDSSRNKVASSFSLAHGGYELNGVILDKKLEKTKLIRQK